MYNSVKKTNAIRRYMESLELHTVAPTLHWKYNKRYISVVEAKIFTPIVKHIGIPVCFLKEKNYNGFFVPKYEHYSVVPVNKCTKPWSGPIISRSNKYMTGLRLSNQ